MFTRCPGCHTVHPVNAALLAQGGGQYRCGKCNKSANALNALFDQWPDAGDRPHGRGQVPELGAAISLEGAESESATEEEALPDESAPSFARRTGANRFSRVFWITTVVILLIATIMNLAGLFGHSLLRHPVIQSSLVSLGIREPAAQKPWRDLSSIHLVSRDMQNLPSSPGALLLNVTMVNRAQRVQPFPGLEVILMDMQGEPLASRLFQPAEYLPPGADSEAGMNPDAYLPISLKLVDPGARAVGFEINFR